MKKPVPQPGDIGFSSSTGWAQTIIRFITISDRSHTFIVGDAFGRLAVLEAGDFAVQVVDYDKHYWFDKKSHHRLFRPNQVTAQEAKEAAIAVYDTLAGCRYGWLQLLWFIPSRAWSLFFRRKFPIRNPFTGGIICSELTWYYLHQLGGEYAKMVEAHLPNEVNAAEIQDLVLDNPKLFDFVLEHQGGAG